MSRRPNDRHRASSSGRGSGGRNRSSSNRSSSKGKGNARSSGRPTHGRASDSARHDRLAIDVHRIVAQALREHVKDPRVALLSITSVRLSRDLSIAHLNVVPLGGQGDSDVLMAGLQAATGFLRSVLAHGLRIRHTPELHFHLDEGLDDSLDMTTRLTEMETQRLSQEQSEPGQSEPGQSEFSADTGADATGQQEDPQ